LVIAQWGMQSPFWFDAPAASAWLRPFSVAQRFAEHPNIACGTVRERNLGRPTPRALQRGGCVPPWSEPWVSSCLLRLYWAILPLVAKNIVAGGAGLYGLL